MIKIFLDANQYLNFYRNQDMFFLLEELTKLKKYILVTEQIENEVLRNKTNVAKIFLANKLKEFQSTQIKNPFFYVKNSEISQKLNVIKKDYQKIQKDIESIYVDTLKDISCGVDIISNKLDKVFINKLNVTADEVARAERRKKFGNPPGKKSDPIGDELTWEQLLSYCRKHNQDEIIFVTSDTDFYVENFDKKLLLNAYLQKELNEIKIILFGNFADALIYLKSQIADIEISTKDLEDISIKISETHCPPHLISQRHNGIFIQTFCEKCNKVFQQEYSDDFE